MSIEKRGPPISNIVYRKKKLQDDSRSDARGDRQTRTTAVSERGRAGAHIVYAHTQRQQGQTARRQSRAKSNRRCGTSADCRGGPFPRQQSLLLLPLLYAVRCCMLESNCNYSLSYVCLPGKRLQNAKSKCVMYVCVCVWVLSSSSTWLLTHTR